MFSLHKFYWNEWVQEWRTCYYKIPSMNNLHLYLHFVYRITRCEVFMWYVDSMWISRIVNVWRLNRKYSMWKCERIIKTKPVKNVEKKQRRVLRTSIWVLKWELLSSLAVQSRLSVIYVQNITPIFHYNILFIPNSEHFWWVLLASDAVMCRIWV